MTISFPFFQILWNWWWVILTIFLWFLAEFLYLWWVRWEVWYKKHKWILLEIKPPAEILKPFKAMEDVIHSLWGVYDSHNWRERWCEGGLPSAPYWFSMEIASLGGEVHFYLRILEEWRDTFESAIYSYYPEAEISLVEDYTKKVPQNVPNPDWDLYSEDFTLLKEDVYPIRTYPIFFEEKPEVPKEEKRIDPIDSLLEALAKLKPAEQLWFQIVAAPILNKDIPWVSRGQALANELAKRPAPKKTRPMFQEAAEALILGPPKEEPKEELGIIAPELRLTPGEKEILKGVENKISKQGYKAWIRMLYLCQVNKPHFYGHYKIGRTYLNHFMTENLNGICYMGPTRTRIHYWLRERRLYLRKRKQFRHYLDRLPAYFPWNLMGEPVFPHIRGIYPLGPGIGQGAFVLNAEELATLYHFPSKIKVPTVPRVEAKKGGPPLGLPTE